MLCQLSYASDDGGRSQNTGSRATDAGARPRRAHSSLKKNSTRGAADVRSKLGRAAFCRLPAYTIYSHHRLFPERLCMPFRITRLALLAVFVAPLAAQSALPSLSDPTISPDGREIAFVSGGDIWSVPSAGGEAHLLVTHPATESRPLFSPRSWRLSPRAPARATFTS
jgi:hypothetical protein